MAAEIVFARGELWSARTSGFQDILRRVREKCLGDAGIGEVLEDAEVMNFLTLYDLVDQDLKRKLTAAIRDAAMDKLKELRAAPDTLAAEIVGVEQLVALAEKFAEQGEGY